MKAQYILVDKEMNVYKITNDRKIARKLKTSFGGKKAGFTILIADREIR